jgi:hypothetical protein
VERVETDDFRRYGRHRRWHLIEFFPDLPDGAGGEVDVEGMAIDGDWLWVVGSHSLKREKPKPEHDADAALGRLTEVEREANRHLLGRIPLAAADPAVPGLRDPARRDGKRRAGCLPLSGKGSALSRRLRRDEHIGRFLDVPAKENGFDVEGIAARGERVLLGLRGPVLRGWALILDLEVRARKKGGLKLTSVCKHFLDLDGLGIRDLALCGDDLLILAGPTMDIDGPTFVYRWPGAFAGQGDTVVPRARLDRLSRIPNGEGFDHAEGLCLLTPPEGPPALLVAYDNPGPGRRLAEGAVALDLFPLPP